MRFVVAGAAAMVLLTGCGTGAESPRAKDVSEAKGAHGGPSDAGGTPAALTEKQVEAALPEGDAVPGLERTPPMVMPPVDPGTGQCVAGQPAQELCVGAVSFGVSTFVAKDEANVSFLLYAYRDAEAAATAYRVHAEERLADPKMRKISLGAIGEQHHALAGTFGGTGDPYVSAMVQVGATLLSIEAFGKAKYANEDRLTDYATMFAERSGQAQQGA